MEKTKRFIVLSIASGLLSFTSLIAHADIFLSADFSKSQDFCSGIANSTWTGEGSATGAIGCSYSGWGKVSGAAPDYQFDLHINKSGGSFLCPNSFDQVLKVSCFNNAIAITNQYINLRGGFTSPNHINASGTITFMGITDNLSMQINRA